MSEFNKDEVRDDGNSYLTPIIMDNLVAESRFNIALVSQKLLIETLSRIDSTKKNHGRIRIPLNEFTASNNVSKQYVSEESLNIALETLNAKIVIKKRDSDEWVAWNLFTECSYADGVYTMKLADEVKGYFLFTPEKNYFRIIKEYTAGFKSKYSLQLYLFAQKNLYQSQRHQRVYLPLIEIKKMYQFDIQSQYKNTDDFKKRVLLPSIREVNAHTDLFIEIQAVREKRTIIGYDFTIRQKKARLAGSKETGSEMAMSRMEETVVEDSIKSTILRMKSIPYDWADDNEKMYEAISYLTDYGSKRMIENYFGDAMQKTLYGMAVRQLALMAASKKLKIGEQILSSRQVIDVLNEKVKTVRDSAYIEDAFIMQAVEAVMDASDKADIKNVQKYLQACLWDALETGEFRLMAEVRRDMWN